MPEDTQGVRPILAPQFPSAQPPAPQKRSTVGWRVGLCVGCGVVLLLAAGLLVGLMTVAPQRLKENGRRAQCRSNLRQIGLACHAYADDNAESFPESLAQLCPGPIIDNVKVFRCPSSSSSHQDAAAGPGAVTDPSSRYVLLPARSAMLPRDFFLAYENVENHKQGFHVLYVDARVEWWSARRLAEFRVKLAEQEAQLPELRRR